MRIIMPFVIGFDMTPAGAQLLKRPMAQGEVCWDPDDANAKVFARIVVGNAKGPWFECMNDCVGIFEFFDTDDARALNRRIEQSPESYVVNESDEVPL